MCYSFIEQPGTKDGTWLGRLKIKRRSDKKVDATAPPQTPSTEDSNKGAAGAATSAELHDAKKGTKGPFTQIKDNFNAPPDDAEGSTTLRYKRVIVSQRPLR